MKIRNKKLMTILIAAFAAIFMAGSALAFVGQSALVFTGTASVQAELLLEFTDMEYESDWYVRIGDEDVPGLSATLAEDNRTITFEVNFTEPGQAATVSSRITNNGTLNAEITEMIVAPFGRVPGLILDWEFYVVNSTEDLDPDRFTLEGLILEPDDFIMVRANASFNVADNQGHEMDVSVAYRIDLLYAYPRP